jgi:hypothetical protein
MMTGMMYELVCDKNKYITPPVIAIKHAILTPFCIEVSFNAAATNSIATKSLQA